MASCYYKPLIIHIFTEEISILKDIIDWMKLEHFLGTLDHKNINTRIKQTCASAAIKEHCFWLQMYIDLSYQA